MAIPITSSFRDWPIEEIDHTDSPHTVTDSSPNVIICDTSGGDVDVIFPTLADNQGRLLEVKNIGSGVVNIDGEGGELIEGETDWDLDEGSGARCRAGATQWGFA